MPYLKDPRTGDRHKPRTGDRHRKNRAGERLDAEGRARSRSKTDYQIIPIDGEGFDIPCPPFTAANGQTITETQVYGLLQALGEPPLLSEKGLSSLSIFRYLFRPSLGHAAIVGFALRYDQEHWLADLPDDAYCWLLGRIPKHLKDPAKPYPDEAAVLAAIPRYRADRPTTWAPVYEEGLPTWEVLWAGFKIAWIPRKIMRLTTTARNLYGPKAEDREIERTVYDAWAYYACSLEKALKASGIAVDARITEGKASRGRFAWERRADTIAYNYAELEAIHRLFTATRNSVNAGLEKAGFGFRLDSRSWYGPGALADKMLKETCFAQDHPLTPLTPDQAAMLDKITADAEELEGLESPASVRYRELNYRFPFSLSYFGGRIEQAAIGYFPKVYDADTISAYPTAMSRLPAWADKPLTVLGPEEAKQAARKGMLGQYLLSWDFDPYHTWHPFPYRRPTGSVCFPAVGTAWIMSPEALTVLSDPQEAACVTIHGAIVLEGTEGLGRGDKPLPERLRSDHAKAVHLLYRQRLELKARRDPAQLAAKLILTSSYGKLVQQIGRKAESPGTFSDLAASFITSYCRATVWSVLLPQKAGKVVVAVQTDGVAACEPLDLPFGTDMGEWTLEEGLDFRALIPGIYTFKNAEGKETTKRRGFGTGWDIELAWAALLDPSKPYSYARHHFVTRNESLLYKDRADACRQWRDSVKTFTPSLATKRVSPKHLPTWRDPETPVWTVPYAIAGKCRSKPYDLRFADCYYLEDEGDEDNEPSTASRWRV